MWRFLAYCVFLLPARKKTFFRAGTHTALPAYRAEMASLRLRSEKAARGPRRPSGCLPTLRGIDQENSRIHAYGPNLELVTLRGFFGSADHALLLGSRGGSLKQRSSALRSWARFSDAIRQSHFSIEASRVAQYAAIFRDHGTYGQYVASL